MAQRAQNGWLLPRRSCVIAKLAEYHEHTIAAKLEVFTDHTLKHLLATAAAKTIVASLVRRVQSCRHRGTA